MAQASGRTPQRRPARLTARRLDALARKKAVDRHPVDAEDATDTNGVQAAGVDQAADRLGMVSGPASRRRTLSTTSTTGPQVRLWQKRGVAKTTTKGAWAASESAIE